MKLIEKRYDVKYSYKLIYQQAPYDAEDQLKKTENINHENEDITVSDESSCQKYS